MHRSGKRFTAKFASNSRHGFLIHSGYPPTNPKHDMCSSISRRTQATSLVLSDFDSVACSEHVAWLTSICMGCNGCVSE